MSKAITLAYQVADIFSRYLAIHNEIFKFSVRKSSLIPGTRKKVDYAAYGVKLAKIQNDLIAVQSAIADLRDDDTKRLGKEIPEHKILDMSSSTLNYLRATVFEQIVAEAKKRNFKDIFVIKDLNGIDRVLKIQK